MVIKNIENVVSNNIQNNKVNDTIKNDLKIDYNFSLANIIINTQLVVNFDLRKRKKL